MAIKDNLRLAGSEQLSPALADSVFMRACRKESVVYTPIWLMRQAGRYQPEFRELRSKVGFLELCRNPELAAQVTVAAVEQAGVDAAIIFADILLPLDALGAGLAFVKGEGPTIARPVRDAADVDKLPAVDVLDSLHYVFEAVKLARKELPGNVPLLGFAGAPFTLASYLIEGGSSRNYEHTKGLFYRQPEAWHKLMKLIVELSTVYLCEQVKAGAQAVQLFDSWVGCLSPYDYEEFVLPHVQKLVTAVKESCPQLPIIYFGTGTTSLLERMAESGASIIGLDWRVDLADSWSRIGNLSVQGNLDPCVLLADRTTIRKQTTRILDRVSGRDGHIFNLGHGVLPETPVDNVRYLVELVHEATKR